MIDGQIDSWEDRRANGGWTWRGRYRRHSDGRVE